MNQFTILHISDSHIGNPKHGTDSRQVLRPLIKDIAKNAKQFAPLNLIVFNGDLAFGQIPEIAIEKQYLLAKTWLTDVHKALGANLGDIPLLVVPGNHDVNRATVTTAEREWILSLTEKEGAEKVRQEMIQNRVGWKRMLERQKEWLAFAKALPGQSWVWNDDLLMLSGTFPLTEGRSVGIVGVNTSWACSGENEYGKVWLGQHQMQTALNAVENSDFKILVSHHPPSWLHPAEKSSIDEKIESSFQLYLHGHEHDAWFSPRRGHLRISAGACYAGALKENGYGWLRVDFDKKEALLKLRTFENKGIGAWKPLHIPEKNNADGESIIRELFSTETSTPDCIGPKQQAQNDSASVTHTPVVLPHFSGLPDIVSYVRVLQDSFSFVWEPNRFLSSTKPALVYWPVRLRNPTPIHAVQCFAAAGLQRKGAKVFLCIDDLGDAEPGQAERLKSTIQRWWKAAGAKTSDLQIRSIKAILKKEQSKRIWRRVQQWFAEQSQYNLVNVLHVSKLVPSTYGDTLISSLETKRSRRLLTPAVVWTGLAHVAAQNPRCRLLTLSGIDERVLWKAWRDCIPDGPSDVGHLYGPELRAPSDGAANKAILMEATNLAWDSLHDIEAALRADLQASNPSTSFVASGRIAHWCAYGCLQLPCFLNDQKPQIQVGSTVACDVEELFTQELSKIPSCLASAVAKWIF